VDAGCSSGKFLCGRKTKFGLNCQAFCDVRGRILDISILCPGSTSDCLAFKGMSLFHKLEDGILAPAGLCIFCNNAYLNTPYMATPYYATVSGGTKGAYNFNHSQLRIRIECSFGILTDRWAILRSAIPDDKKSGRLTTRAGQPHGSGVGRKAGTVCAAFNSVAQTMGLT
jgi:hypothetical protein